MNEIATIQQVDQLLPTEDALKKMKQVADYMVTAKMCPPGYKDGSDLMVVALRGREMGVPMGQAIQGMFPMKGRIGYMGGFLLARVRQILPWSSITIKESTKEICVLTCKRDKDDPGVDVEFSMEEVLACNYHQTWKTDDKGGNGKWTIKQTWKDQKNMLYWRCVSRAVNRVFSDVFGAPVYQYDELQDNDTIDVTPAGKAQVSVPYATEANSKPSTEDWKKQLERGNNLIEDADIVSKATLSAVDKLMPEHVVNAPIESTKPEDQMPDEPVAGSTDVSEEKRSKMSVPMQDALILALEKDLWSKDCTSKKQAEVIFEAFKNTGAPGKLLTSGFKLFKKRCEEMAVAK